MNSSTIKRYSPEWVYYVFIITVFWVFVIVMHIMAITLLPVWQVWYFYAAVWGAISHIKWVLAKARDLKRITAAHVMENK
ncbi:MAG: hypothetical protein GY774_17590 [Planctomycetes bacterium]|nr:hypothetical protein [Planctomycetota bacterium]